MNFPLRKRPFPGARTARLGAALRGALLSFFAVASFLVMSSRAFAADGDAEDVKKAIERHKVWVQKLQTSATTLQEACDPKTRGDAIRAARAEMKVQILAQIRVLLESSRDLDEDSKAGKKLDAARKADLARIQEKVTRLRALIKDDKAGDAAPADAADVDPIVKATLPDLDQVCTLLCNDAAPNPGEGRVRLCAFQDPVLANAAVLTDLPTVRKLIAYAGRPWRQLEAKYEVDLAVVFPDVRAKASATGGVGTKGIPEAVADVATGGVGIDLAAVSARTAEVALAALAKVIEDRAKRESLVWFLEEMNLFVCGEDTPPACGNDAECKRVCASKDGVTTCEVPCAALDTTKAEKCKAAPAGEECAAATSAAGACWQALPKNLIRREIRTHWLPSTCALAKSRMDYAQMGGGAKLLDALRGAVATDVRRWPGVAAGLGVGAVFWLDGGKDMTLPDLFHCAGHETDDPRCAPTIKLRAATLTLVEDLMGGASASASFYSYGTAIDGLNRDKGKLHDDGFQLAACTMSVPHVVQEYKKYVMATGVTQAEGVEALLLSGLTGSPACWTAIGQGIELTRCNPGDPKCGTGTLKSTLQAEKPLERLTTIVRWGEKIQGPAASIAARVADLEAAWKTYLAAVEELRKAGNAAVPTLPPLDPSKMNDAKTFAEVLQAFDKYVKDTARTAQQSQLVKVLQASSALARISLDFGVTLTSGLSGLADKNLYPGLCTAEGKTGCDSVEKVEAALQKTSTVLARYSKLLGSVESALTADWGGAVAQLVATVRATVEASCRTDEKCALLVKRLSRYSGLFTALISETDPNKVAEALDAAAMPIGGWRQKQVPGTTMVSITSLAGLGLVSAEWRWGQYGVFKEAGNQTHVNPPVLQLPLGVDLTWAAHGGGASAGLFFSLIDPAAYLQYDADQQGRLPGAQLLTSLAPGLALRTSLWASPLVASVYGVFRPNFRAWDPAVTAPAAHVFQLGVGLSVDVTLFEIYTSHSE